MSFLLSPFLLASLVFDSQTTNHNKSALPYLTLPYLTATKAQNTKTQKNRLTKPTKPTKSPLPPPPHQDCQTFDPEHKPQ
jgi:hypothetical protein